MRKSNYSNQTLVHNVDGETLLSHLDGLTKEVASLKEKVTPPPVTELVSVIWTANFLDVSRPTVYEWIKKGILKAYKIGNQTRLKRHEVESALTQVGERRAARS